MIYTITLNPSLDYYQHVSGKVKLGSLNRTSETSLVAAGKGINVSVVLNLLGIKSTVLGFFGGFTGQYMLEALRRHLNIFLRPTMVEGVNRINTKVIADVETEINAQGPDISGSEMNNLMNQLNALTNKDLVIISGSSVANDVSGFQEQIIKFLSQKKIPFILDIPGESLKKYIKHKPMMVKPNKEELKEMLGTEPKDIKGYATQAKKLLEMGTSKVFLSLGEEGALILDGKKVIYCEAPKVKVVSTIGAGDALLAGYLSKFEKTNDEKVSLAFALALSALKVSGANLSQLEEAEKLAKTLKPRSL
jgi:1-phosphofructokinase